MSKLHSVNVMCACDWTASDEFNSIVCGKGGLHALSPCRWVELDLGDEIAAEAIPAFDQQGQLCVFWRQQLSGKADEHPEWNAFSTAALSNLQVILFTWSSKCL